MARTGLLWFNLDEGIGRIMSITQNMQIILDIMEKEGVWYWGSELLINSPFTNGSFQKIIEAMIQRGLIIQRYDERFPGEPLYRRLV